MGLSPKQKAGAVLILAAVLASAGLAWYKLPRHTPAPATDAYADARQCQPCHAEIYRTYQQVGMARGFRSAPVDAPEGTFVHTASGRRYQVLRRDGRLFQRRSELDAAGREQNAYELEITHVIGSGNHARTFLHRTAAGEIFELPLTW